MVDKVACNQSVFGGPGSKTVLVRAGSGRCGMGVPSGMICIVAGSAKEEGCGRGNLVFGR